MADDTAPGTPAPLELLHDDTAGYCDPVTGICELPGTAGNAAEPERPQPQDDYPDKVLLVEFSPDND